MGAFRYLSLRSFGMEWYTMPVIFQTRTSVSKVATLAMGLWLALAWTHVALGQMITTSVPMQRFGDSFYQNSGIGWSARGPNWSMNVPSPGGQGFYWNQGSQRSASMVAPSLTTTNGYPGSFFSGSVRPFVIGWTPVVGSAPMIDISPVVQAAQIPTRAAAQASVQDQVTRQTIAANNWERQNKIATDAYQRGLEAEEQGKLKMARANFRKAFTHATPPLKNAAYQKLVAHGWAK